jgi:geranylgeranyl reductase family protein
VRRDLPIAVIGAGPAGAAAALTLARHGFARVTLLERRAWPRPKTCAGGLGPRALAWLARARLLDAVAPLSVAVRGLRFTGPSGPPRLIDGTATVARSVSRARFDALLVDRAVAAGAVFRPDRRVVALTRTPEGVMVHTPAETLECAAVIVATGAAGAVPGVVRPPHRAVESIMARYRGFPHTPGVIEMIFTPALAPYYAWLFPEPDGGVNVGLIADRAAHRRSLHRLFDEVLALHFGARLTHARPAGPRAGAPLHVARRVGAVADGRVLLVGECAGFVNAATGEGIPWGLESGERCALALAREPDVASAARAWQASAERHFRLRLLCAAAARRFIGSAAFGPVVALGRLPSGLLERLVAKV